MKIKYGKGYWLSLQAYPAKLDVSVTQRNIFVPPRSVNTTRHVTTGIISTYTHGLIQLKPLSIADYKNQLDTAVHINYGSQYFETSRDT